MSLDISINKKQFIVGENLVVYDLELIYFFNMFAEICNEKHIIKNICGMINNQNVIKSSYYSHCYTRGYDNENQPRELLCFAWELFLRNNHYSYGYIITGFKYNENDNKNIRHLSDMKNWYIPMEEIQKIIPGICSQFSSDI